MNRFSVAPLPRIAAGSLCFAVSLLVAQDRDPAAGMRRAVQDASRALQAGNAALFLAAFDREFFPEFRAFREQVVALVRQRRIASSVEVGIPEEHPEGWTVEVDWLLHLTPQLDPGPVEQRRAAVTLGLRRRGGRWKIARIEPTELFASGPSDR